MSRFSFKLFPVTLLWKHKEKTIQFWFLFYRMLIANVSNENTLVLFHNSIFQRFNSTRKSKIGPFSVYLSKTRIAQRKNGSFFVFW